MPRKNLKRKNVNGSNSQGGGGGGGRRRKAKPIKFNPNDIENEQKLMLATSIEKDENDDDGDGDTATIAIEMDCHRRDDNVEQRDNKCRIEKMPEKEMQSINGSASNQVNKNSNDRTTEASDTDNACPSNQMDKIDDAQNEDDSTAAVTDATSATAAAADNTITKWDGTVESDNLLSNRTFNYCHFRFALFSFLAAILLPYFFFCARDRVESFAYAFHFMFAPH